LNDGSEKMLNSVSIGTTLILDKEGSWVHKLQKPVVGPLVLGCRTSFADHFISYKKLISR